MEDECRILHTELKKTTSNAEEEMQQDQQIRIWNGKCVGNRKWIPITRVCTLTGDIEQPNGHAKDKNGDVNTCNPFEVLAKNTNNEVNDINNKDCCILTNHTKQKEKTTREWIDKSFKEDSRHHITPLKAASSTTPSIHSNDKTSKWGDRVEIEQQKNWRRV